MTDREPGSDELLGRAEAQAETVIMDRYDTEQAELDAEEERVRATSPLPDPGRDAV